MTNATALPFSRSRELGPLVFLSGELPLLPDGSVPEGIEAQTTLTLKRIAATLATQGLTLADVVSVTAYLTDPNDFGAFNCAYAQAMAEPHPVRTTIRAELMLPGARLELSVVAGRA